jgi:hypothetical protein
LLRPIVTLGNAHNFITISPSIVAVKSENRFYLLSIAGQVQLGKKSPITLWGDFNNSSLGDGEWIESSFMLGFRFHKKNFHINAAYANYAGDSLPYLNFGLRF